MKDEFDKKKIIEMIEEKLPSKAEILCLSLTGSRAFGWAGEDYDYDIHGIFAAENFWDYVHFGKDNFDTNLWELDHVYSDIYYQHFEFFMNISNPFYINRKFDYRGLMKFCTVEAVRQIQGDISRQIHSFEISPHPRTALHSYRILMVPINFLKKKRIELDIFKLNKTYHFKQLEKLKLGYTRGGQDWNKNVVRKDLKSLFRIYKKLSQKKEEKVDIKKAQKWLERMKQKFY